MMMDAVVSHFLPFPLPKSRTKSMVGSKFREEAPSQQPQKEMRGKNSEAGRFPAQTQLSDALVVGLRLGSV